MADCDGHCVIAHRILPAYFTFDQERRVDPKEQDTFNRVSITAVMRSSRLILRRRVSFMSSFGKNFCLSLNNPLHFCNNSTDRPSGSLTTARSPHSDFLGSLTISIPMDRNESSLLMIPSTANPNRVELSTCLSEVAG